MGHAIIGIDTTADGKWLLATTSKYLMLVPVELEDGRTGFDVSMGNKNKPVPFKLQILPQDLVKYGIAHFIFSTTRTSNKNPDIVSPIIEPVVLHLLSRIVELIQ